MVGCKLILKAMESHWIIFNVIVLVFLEGNILVTLEDVVEWGETKEARR